MAHGNFGGGSQLVLQAMVVLHQVFDGGFLLEEVGGRWPWLPQDTTGRSSGGGHQVVEHAFFLLKLQAGSVSQS